MGKMVDAICAEIALRKNEFIAPLQSIYFGGGTPSLLSTSQLDQIMNCLQMHYKIAANAEITLEANPENINSNFLKELRALGINRLSIGVQSFYLEHLSWMNRSHNADEARASIALAHQYQFDVSSIDLIYGFEQLSMAQWKENLRIASESGLKHLSCYSLTIEEKTPFYKKQSLKNKLVDEEMAKQHFDFLHEFASINHWNHYEISNLALDKNYSRHNTAYWQSSPYLGFGPSAHSFDGIKTRRWNIADNLSYIDRLLNNQIFWETEVLSNKQRINEEIMVGLRTKNGISKQIIAAQLADASHKVHQFIANGFAKTTSSNFYLTKEGWWCSDHIISELFTA